LRTRCSYAAIGVVATFRCFRALGRDELERVRAGQRSGYLVARIIDRAELERAVRAL
jgi:precorrin-6x reductase